VLAEPFWRRAFNGDPAIVGRTIVLDDRSLTVVGVMPDAFQFPYASASLLPGASMQARTDVWQPIEHALTVRGRFSHVLARLRPGVTRAAAAAELAALGPRVQPAATLAVAGPRGYEIVPLAEDVVGAAVSRPLFLLLAAAGLVLALACANVANLLLVRVTRRQREIAVRAGLGASPLRLARQFLAESLLLSLAGGAAGLALGWAATRRLLAAAAAQVPRAPEVALDWRVFTFLFLLCTLVGVVVGLAPAVIALRRDTRALHNGGGRATMTTAERALRDGLVVAEVALAFCLAVGASLLLRELLRLRATDLGMRTDNVVTLHLGRRVPFSRTGASDADIRRYDDVEARVGALPGVRAAGLTQMLPLQSWGWFSNSSDFFEKGRPPRQPVFPIELRFVTPGYFRALGITVRRGRSFTAADTRDAPAVIVINDALARAQFGDGDPIGRQTNRGTVIGVIAGVRGVHPDRPPQPEIYFATAQNWSQVPDLGMTLVVSADGAPASIVDRVRSAVHDVDPLLAVFEVKTMEQVVADSLSLFRLFLSLIAGFAGVAVVLALTGTYGVVSYVSASRVREFAVRMALGANPDDLTLAVLRQGAWLTAIGLGAGITLVVAGAPLLGGLPVTVRPPDPLIVMPLAAGLAAVTLAACLLPARRAARVDPMTVLRAD
jgi:predicted permease